MKVPAHRFCEYARARGWVGPPGQDVGDITVAGVWLRREEMLETLESPEEDEEVEDMRARQNAVPDHATPKCELDEVSACRYEHSMRAYLEVTRDNGGMWMCRRR